MGTLCHHSSVETANHGAGGPATPRRAATVVVVRSVDGGGVEVLVLRRSRSSRFAPGFVVFPGGAVDDGDRELARRWFGSPTELDRACAVRELREEAGLVLGSDGIITAPGGRSAGAHSMDVRALPEIGHWVAPDFLPIRFDARFFAALAETGAAPRPDGTEIERAWWDRPAQVLDAQRAGEVALMWPTMVTLNALTSCRDVGEVLTGLRVDQVEPPTSWPPGPGRPMPDGGPRLEP